MKTIKKNKLKTVSEDAFFIASIIQNNEELTEEDVEDMIDSAEEMLKKLHELFNETF